MAGYGCAHACSVIITTIIAIIIIIIIISAIITRIIVTVIVVIITTTITTTIVTTNDACAQDQGARSNATSMIITDATIVTTTDAFAQGQGTHSNATSMSGSEIMDLGIQRVVSRLISDELGNLPVSIRVRRGRHLPAIVPAACTFTEFEK